MVFVLFVAHTIHDGALSTFPASPVLAFLTCAPCSVETRRRAEGSSVMISLYPTPNRTPAAWSLLNPLNSSLIKTEGVSAGLKSILCYKKWICQIGRVKSDEQAQSIFQDLFIFNKYVCVSEYGYVYMSLTQKRTSIPRSWSHRQSWVSWCESWSSTVS